MSGWGQQGQQGNSWGQQGGQQGGWGQQGGQGGQNFPHGQQNYSGQGFQGGQQGFGHGHGHGHGGHHGHGTSPQQYGGQGQQNYGGNGQPYPQDWQQGGQQGYGQGNQGFNQVGHGQGSDYTQAFHPSPNQAYKIVAAGNPSFSLDASNGVQDKNKLIIWQHHGNSNQQWRFQPDGQGNYQIINVASGGTLEIPNGSNAQQCTQCVISQPNGTINEKWRIQPAQGQASGKGFNIVSAVNGMVLDINAGKMQKNTSVIIYKNNNQINQAWAIAPV